MAHLTRRDLLKTLAAASIAGAVPGVAQESDALRPWYEKEITLNVVFHGLWVLNFTNLCIEVFTPYVKDHMYRAGDWDATWKDVNDVKKGYKYIYDLEKNHHYRLRGVDYRSRPPQTDSDFKLEYS